MKRLKKMPKNNFHHLTNRHWTDLALILLLAPSFSIAAPKYGESPEADSKTVSKYLKSIDYSAWTEIAGGQVSETYVIVTGDTLSDISKRLFGDAFYWPKIWAINNDSITNPHFIRPGQKIRFEAGSSSSLPVLGLGGNPNEKEPIIKEAPPEVKIADASANKKSEEWRMLPRQRWEVVSIRLPAEVDPDGIDSRSKVFRGRSSGMKLPVVALSDDPIYRGEIYGSRSESKLLTLGDNVYVTSGRELQVGNYYSVVGEAADLKSRQSDRLGLAYPILGEIRILGVRDDLFVGKITSSTSVMFRGAVLTDQIPRVDFFKPIPGPEPLEGTILFDKESTSTKVAQNKLAFIDRGSSDGVKPGMVFRSYQKIDPVTEDRVTNADFIIEADFLVIHTSEKFSTLLVMRSLRPVLEEQTAVLLTDVYDLLLDDFSNKAGKRTEYDRELDDLDRLMPEAGLGDSERRTLEQLENWDGNPEGFDETGEKKRDQSSEDSEFDDIDELNDAQELNLNDDSELPPSIPETQSETPASEETLDLDAPDSGPAATAPVESAPLPPEGSDKDLAAPFPETKETLDTKELGSGKKTDPLKGMTHSSNELKSPEVDDASSDALESEAEDDFLEELE